jgi:uncharacterized protein (TIGR03084 family)
VDPLAAVLDDLAAETSSLLEVLEGLEEAAWATPTPAEAWDIRAQIVHLTYFDETAALAVSDPEAFAAHRSGLRRLGPDSAAVLDPELEGLGPAGLLARFGHSRRALIDLYRRQDRRQRVPWYGPDMSVISAATARLMETWAHGVDVRDALGAAVEWTPRLRHVAHIGFATRRFSLQIHGMEAPPGDPRVELATGDGGVWTFGPEDTPDRLSGPALDFCLVVTQRRPLDATALEMTGEAVADWMSVAQAFAGRPTTTQRR